MEVEWSKRDLGEIARIYPSKDKNVYVKLYQKCEYDTEARERVLGPVNIQVHPTELAPDNIEIVTNTLKEAARIAKEVEEKNKTRCFKKIDSPI